MPELPDLENYVHALAARVVREPVRSIEIVSPFVLRTAVPPIGEAVGHFVVGVRRLGKRLVLSLDDDRHLVFHLMRAGRLRWHDGVSGRGGGGRAVLLRIAFPGGVLVVAEAGTRRRVSLHYLSDAAAVAAHDPGGLELFDIDEAAFEMRLRSESHTLKRALTDPRLFSGIGGAYSDEILHRACLSPLAPVRTLDGAAVRRLFLAAREVLVAWTTRLRSETGDGFPAGVTAFREGMAVHGRFGRPCPACGAPIQRIVYAGTETNYCPRCQTDGKILADRALSRLLKASFPRDVDELG